MITQHDNINMNQDSSINSITKAQNIKQTFHQYVKKTQKTNPVFKMKVICRKYAEQDQPNKNPKSKRDSVIILGDCMIKHTNGWEIAKKLKSECKAFVRNYSMYG